MKPIYPVSYTHLFVQKSSNHVLNKTSIGKFHEAEAHTATGFVVCKTEALQEVFQQKKEEVLLAKQEVPDESEGKNEKTDKKGTQEVTPGKEPTEPASTAGGQTPSAPVSYTHLGAGKTECAKFFSQFIPAGERVITIEDNPEWHYSQINPGKDCVELRINPDRCV